MVHFFKEQVVVLYTIIRSIWSKQKAVSKAEKNVVQYGITVGFLDMYHGNTEVFFKAPWSTVVLAVVFITQGIFVRNV